MRPVFRSNCIAPLIQAWTHGASKHCRHRSGKLSPPLDSTKTLFCGGSSSSIASYKVLLVEWAIAHASSQLLQPRQCSLLVRICFNLIPPLDFFKKITSFNLSEYSSSFHRPADTTKIYLIYLDIIVIDTVALTASENKKSAIISRKISDRAIDYSLSVNISQLSTASFPRFMATIPCLSQRLSISLTVWRVVPLKAANCSWVKARE